MFALATACPALCAGSPPRPARGRPRAQTPLPSPAWWMSRAACTVDDPDPGAAAHVFGLAHPARAAGKSDNDYDGRVDWLPGACIPG